MHLVHIHSVFSFMMYPLAFGLPATVPSRGCGAAQCKVDFSRRGPLYGSSPLGCHSACSKAKQKADHILIFTLVAQALEEGCPNFSTFALFKRWGECCRNFDIYFYGLGTPCNTQKHSNSHQNPPQIDRKSLKVCTWGGSGHPWAPSGPFLGST